MRSLVSAFVCYVLLTTSCFADKVLILDATVRGGMSSLEAQAALGLGYTVDLVSDEVWKAMAHDNPSVFSDYRAIILGDPDVGVYAIDAAVATRGVWGPKVTGNILIFGGDPANHPPYGSILTTNAVRFAAAQPGKTGLYIALSHYYQTAISGTPVEVLEPFGMFTVKAFSYDQIHVVAAHPALSSLTDANLSHWDNSAHEAFESWPDSGPDKFLVLAIGEGVGSYTAQDLSVGTPYALARGQGLAPLTNRLTLSPITAQNPTNATHTVCATVVNSGALADGIRVGFNVTNGPNAGVTGSAMSDAEGVACFTYAGTGGVGTDTIVAQYTNAPDDVVSSDPVTKTWYDPCGAAALSAEAFVVCQTKQLTVRFSEIVDAAAAGDPANYTLDHGLTVTAVSFLPDTSYAVLTADQDFVPGTTYTVQVSNVHDLCGRYVSPNPYLASFTCIPLCPELICPSNIVVDCDGPGGTRVHYDVHLAAACTNATVYCYPLSESLFSVGTTVVQCMATSLDGSSNSSACSFTVTVEDHLPPEIHCPSNLLVYSACSDVPVPFSVTATDNCCVMPVQCTPAPGTRLGFGTTPVHCLVYDCNGNSNTCDFTVQVVQVPDAGPPQLIACPTNILICATNGCGIMPDARSQVQAAEGGATLYVSQNIPPGTVLCHNTNVTFTVSNLCGGVVFTNASVIVGPCCCNGLLALQVTNITVWEGSGASIAHNFPTRPMDPRLLAIPDGPSGNVYDFSTPDEQFYDVYLSDADGTPNTNGCCVTIVCNHYLARTNYDAGANIDAVELDVVDGLRLGATSFGSVQLGQGLTDPNLLFTSGAAANALGLSDGVATALGYDISRITLCFSTPCGPGMTASWVGSNIRLTWEATNSPSILPKLWQLISSGSPIGPWNATGVTNSPYICVATNPAAFFRLRGP